MPDLPMGDYDFYGGVDPGLSGAISLINAAGTTVQVWDLPMTAAKIPEYDLPELHKVFKQVNRFPNIVMGLEWPTTRPKDGAERMERFGRGKGILQTFLYLMGFDFYLISPMLWKGRLGLAGKTVVGSNKTCATLYETYYPEYASLIRGPRGGLKDGRMDASLIAHFLRTRNIGGLQSIVDRFGKDSAEAMAAVLGKTKPNKKNISTWG